MALNPGEVLSGGVVRDASGRMVVAVDPSSSVPVAGSAFTGTLIGGTGDNLSYSGATTTGQSYEAFAGTAGTPDTNLNALAKYSRTINLNANNTTGDGAEQASAGGGIITGTSSNQVQTVGWYGVATNQGTAVGSKGSPDACGMYGVGRVFGGSVGVGMGGFFRGQSDTSTGNFSAVQVQSYNGRGVDDSVSSTGFNSSQGVWLWADGANRSAAGIALGNPFGRQFHTGLYFNAQVNGALTGPTLTNDIRSDSSATNGIVIAGSKTVGLAVASGGGYAVIGATARMASSPLLSVQGPNATTDPLVEIGNTTNNAYTVRLRTSSAQHAWVIAHATNDFFTGTAQGDAGMWVPTSTNAFHIAGSSSVIKVKGDNTLSFFNSTTVAQNATAFTNTAAQAASFDLPASYTLAQLGAVVVQLIKQLGSTSGYGLVKATTNF